MLPRPPLPPATLLMLERALAPVGVLAKLAMVLMAALPAGLAATLASVLVLMPVPARRPLRPPEEPPARLVTVEAPAGLGLDWRSLRWGSVPGHSASLPDDGN